MPRRLSKFVQTLPEADTYSAITFKHVKPGVIFRSGAAFSTDPAPAVCAPQSYRLNINLFHQDDINTAMVRNLLSFHWLVLSKYSKYWALEPIPNPASFPTCFTCLEFIEDCHTCHYSMHCQEAIILKEVLLTYRTPFKKNFTSLFSQTVAHEIGHNLGMNHDFNVDTHGWRSPKKSKDGRKCTNQNYLMDYYQV